MLRQVEIQQGRLAGLAAEDPAVTVFRAVPFAAPPVGELRWRAPRPAPSWDGVRESFDFAPIAMQPMSSPQDFYGREWQVDPDTPMSEDCLYLNIWTPSLRGNGIDARIEGGDGRGLPVMVWIHGGGFQTGTPAEKEFNGEHLARLGVVVVSIAYRLNTFGFLAHPDTENEAGEGEPCANFGFLDQRMGIRWVRDNIAAFGGNPDNITVFGQSAGAASTLAQSCSPMNKGLFQRAIMQSGGGIGLFNRNIWSLGDSQRNATRFFSELGVGSLRAARSIPANELLQAAIELPACEWSGQHVDWPPLANWLPCVDGRFITGQYRQTLTSGRCVPQDLLVGNTTGEFLQADSNGVIYPAGEHGNLEMIDAWLAGGGKPAYRYRFDVAMPGDDAGAFHSSDLWFTFATLQSCWRPFEGWHFDLARHMSRCWTRFAATGDPNGADCPRWVPCMLSGEDGYMNFGRSLGMR